MNCASCGRRNPEGARFCGGCGTPLAPRCPACGTASESAAAFCIACGTALDAGRSPAGAGAAVARKVVTIVFADLVGSTSLHERLDAESTRRVMDRYYRALRSAVDSHGGTVVKLLGDGVMAAFGVPRVAEDDAIRAVRAAVAMQHAFRALIDDVGRAVLGPPSREPGAAIGLRVAVNTGEVVVSDDHTDVVGDPVNVAARLQQEAHDGDVLIGESTRRLVGDLVTLAPFGDLTLKGRSESVAAYRVVSLERPAGAAAVPFVGRDEELRRLRAVHHAAVSAPGARLAVLLGSPGLGKSRLLDEFARRLGGAATVLAARCDAAGGATFAPIAGALRALLDLETAVGDEALRAAVEAAIAADESEPARIAAGVAALLAATPASPEETFFVVRRFLAGLAAARPVVLEIDDVQWAEPLLLDLIEHLVQWSPNVPLFVLAAARPELRDTRASLTVAAGLVADVVTLAGLDAGAATRLAANVIGAGELPAAIAGRVLAASEGNPLFVGELVRMLVHDGALRQEGDRWIAAAEPATLEMPPTIQALLAARIERLRPEERAVLERAAVVGRHFSRSAVAHLLPPELRPGLEARLESLRRSELIEPDAGHYLGEPAVRFHHALVRDAAYRRLLKGTRAELHGRLADWIESRAGDALEHEESIGWHLEQAHQHLRELGPIDEQGRAIGERAARYLAAAGRRALARDDLPLAAGLLGRAIDRLDSADATRADLALDWCEALLAAGDVAPAAAAIAELERFIDREGLVTGGWGPAEGAVGLRRSQEPEARSHDEVLTAATASPASPQPPAPSPSLRRLRAWHTCFAGQLAALTDPQALRATADAVATAAEEFAALGDAAGEAKAYSVQALALARLGSIGASEAALDSALEAARQARDRRRANAVLAGAPLAALWGPSPVTRASGRCLDVVRVLRITQGAPAVEAVALRCQAVLEALRGRADAARRMIASARRLVQELGITHRLLEADVFAGLIELLEGDAVAAERWLRGAYDGLRGRGLGIDAAQAAALLGRALLAQDRAEEAETLSHESEALAGDDIKAAIAWRGVRAEALARRGGYDEALDLARAAVGIAAATDALLDHADARQTLAFALRAAGRAEEGAVEEARAGDLWEAKGATLLVERARRAGPSAPAGRAPAATPARAGRRRVPANGATAHLARMVAAMASGDADSLSPLLADEMETVHHPTGVTFDKRGNLASLRMLLGFPGLTFGGEPLATLGESLALCRHLVSASSGSLAELDLGNIESDQFLLIEVDEDERARRVEFFAANRLGDGVARLYERYAALPAEGPARERAAATARSVATILGPPDVDRFAAVVDPDIELLDHRRAGMGAARGAEAFVTGFRALFEITEDLSASIDDVLAARPDLLLARRVSSGTERGGGGPFERHLLVLWTFGPDGRVTRNEEFDVDREEEALARLDELAACPDGALAREDALASGPLASEGHEAGTARRASLTRAFTGAFAARDWEALSAVLAPDLVVNDRRLLGWESLHGPEAYIAALRSLVELAPDVQLRLDHVEMSEPRFLYVTTWVGTRDGGAFEDPTAIVAEIDAENRIRRLDAYDIDRLDDLRRSFAAPAANARERSAAASPPASAARLDPLRIPPNAATRAMRRWHERAQARDWEGLREVFAPSFAFEERRHLIRDSGDLDKFVASVRVAVEMGADASLATLATSGDSLALMHLRFSVRDGATTMSELDVLQLVEVDTRGRIVAAISFDPDDRRGASLEMMDRYFRSAAARWTPAAQIELVRAMNDHDLERARAALTDDFYFYDRRRTGVGRIGNADDYVESLAALYEQSPDLIFDTLYHVAADERGTLSVGRMLGTLVDGGEFESIFVRLNVYAGGHGIGAELFEVEDLDLARARFEELRASKAAPRRRRAPRSRPRR